MRCKRYSGFILAAMAGCGLALQARAADTPMDVLAKTQASGWTITVEAPDNQPILGNRCELVAQKAGQRFSLNIHDDFQHCGFYGAQLAAGPALNGKSVLVFLSFTRGYDATHTPRLLAAFRLDANGLHKLGEEAFVASGYTHQGMALTGATGKVMFTFDPLETGDNGVEDDRVMFVPALLSPGCGGMCLKPALTPQQQQLLRDRFARNEAAALNEAATDEGADKDFIRDTGKAFLAFMDGRPMQNAPSRYMPEHVALRQDGIALELVSSETLVGQNNRYTIAHLLDGNPATTWATRYDPEAVGYDRDGLFKIVFMQPVAVSSLTIWNGLQSSRELFLANQRVKELKVNLVGVSGDTASRIFELQDKMGSQTLNITAEAHPATVKALVFTVQSIYPGKKYTDLCISGMAIGH